MKISLVVFEIANPSNGVCGRVGSTLGQTEGEGYLAANFRRPRSRVVYWHIHRFYYGSYNIYHDDDVITCCCV